MELQILGCYGGLAPGRPSSGYLLDGHTLLDAGTVASVLPPAALKTIRRVLVSHAHLDHVKELPFLLQGCDRTGPPIEIFGLPAVLETLRAHLFNNALWVDYSHPSTGPVMAYRELADGETREVGPYRVTCVGLNHIVPDAGYVIEGGGAALAFVTDTTRTEGIWRACRERGVTHALVEVALPNEREEFARRTGHYTPQTLAADLAGWDQPPLILVVHRHQGFADEIAAQMAALPFPSRVVNPGDRIGL